MLTLIRRARLREIRPRVLLLRLCLRELRRRVAAEWTPADLSAVAVEIESGALSLDGLITHRAPAREAEAAYRTAFSDPSCLKLLLDWSGADATS